MSRIKLSRVETGPRRFSTTLALCLCIAALLLQQGARAVPLPTDALKFFKNFFVTGGYVAGGTGMWGQDTGTINMSGAPVGAEALAAFLYWQVVSSEDPDVFATEGTFNGLPLNTPPELPSTEAGPLGAQLSPITGLGGTAACLLNGGFGGSDRQVYTYRADVLRFLDVGMDGKHRINGAYTVALPNNGTATRTLGATLVVIYRHPHPATPLSAFVIYDGVFTKQQQQTMSQRIEGFYDPANVPGEITYIAGSAQSGLAERLTGPFTTEDDPFDGALGNAWDNVTRATNPLGGASFFDTSIEPRYTGLLSLLNDCVTVGAIVYRTEVNDPDGDGLLTRWEENDQSDAAPLQDPKGELLPYLGDMGADPGRKDLFVQIASMATSGTLTYGGVPGGPAAVSKDLHTHEPTNDALRMAGDALWCAGTAGCNAATDPLPPGGIFAHFDVGNAYPTYAAVNADGTDDYAERYLVRGANARGGAIFNETVTQCTPLIPDDTPWTMDQPWNCQFEFYPGTVGWKSGYRYIRDLPSTLLAGGTVETDPTIADAAHLACDTAETDGNPLTTCNRVFDSNRKHMVHNVLFVHALGLPKVSCLLRYDANAANTPDPWDTDNAADPGLGFPIEACQFGSSADPLFHVPVTNTGVGDFPGGDAIEALGAFDDAAGLPIGTPYMQAATLMHELGHNFHLRHGAVKLFDGLIEPDPPCKSNYQSVMNYLFQLRGLFNDVGGPIADFSGQTFSPLDETGLPSGLDSDVDTSQPPRYRTGWYAPKANVPFGSPATKHCDGTPLLYGPDGDDPDLDPDPLEPAMIRVDSATVADTSSAIVWDMNPGDGQGPQDINFDGTLSGPGAPLHGFNDWANLRLNQVASRRNVGGWYWVLNEMTSQYAAFMGPLSLNTGRGDMGRGDMGRADMGRADMGRADMGRGDMGRGDMGRADMGRADMGRADMGRADMGRGDMGRGDMGRGDMGIGPDQDVSAAEASYELAVASGLLGPPTDVKAFVRGTDGAGGTNSSVPMDQFWVPTGEPRDCSTLMPADCHRVRIDWTAVGAASYRVYRGVVGEMPEEITSYGISETPPGSGKLHLIDPVEFPNDLRVAYFVTATFVVDSTESETGPSDPAMITTVNVAPVADPQSLETLEDIDKDITLTATDPDTTVLTFSIVTGPSHGTLTNLALPQLTYDPNPDYNSYDGPESFTFKVHESSTWNDLGIDSNPGTVGITVIPVNDAPSFTPGPNQTVNQGDPAQSVPNWATNISVGPPNEGAGFEGQTVSFEITGNSNPSLFSVGPAISPDGTLTYTPDPTQSGSATIKVRLRDSGGTANGGIETSGEATFTITVNPFTLITFQRTDVWMTTSSANRTFDLKAEVLKNGVPVLEKIITNTTLGYGTTFNKAIYKQISPFLTTSVGFLATDRLSVRVSIKVSNSSPGGNNASGAIRLWYNIPTPPGNDSHLHANRGGTNVKYYMITPFALQLNGSVAGPTTYVGMIVYKTGYSVIGTWSITGP